MGTAQTAGYAIADWSGPSMGGQLRVAVAAPPASHEDARAEARRVYGRVNSWARRLTRFDSSSDLMRLNADPSPARRIRPTLAAVLCWADRAASQAPALLDVTLLEARLAAETGSAGSARSTGDRASGVGAVHPAQPEIWRIRPGARWSRVERRPGVRFDLDGVAKGWLADRAGELLLGWPGTFVDADGDLALSASAGIEWRIEVADPRTADGCLATLRFAADEWRATIGVATSGTSVHRWPGAGGGVSHHLIDPLTGRPALTDVVQATVVAPTAREAEVIAKAAVILGSEHAAGYLAQAAVHAAVLLLESGEVVATPGTERWLA